MPTPRILIVEDERIVGFNLRRQLIGMGYDVPMAVASGTLALDAIEEVRPDLILMDINIEGELDGIATAARIPAEYHIPVIYLTAYSEDETIKRASATNPYGYLLKPIAERELYTMTQVTLARCHAESALRVADERLREARKIEAIGQIAGGVAHEFNNILGIIYGNIELLGDQTDGEPILAALLQEMFSAAGRGEKLTQKLLAFSGQQLLQPDAISVSGFVSKLTAGLLPMLGESTELRVDLPPDLWMIGIDSEEFEAVLFNLASNACDAMPNGGRLTIEARNETIGDESAMDHPEVTSGRYVVLTVTDTGLGMPQNVLERAFEPFFTTKPVGRGTGLGLSQALGFVKQSGGQIRIESTPGLGTRVLLYLPAIIENVAIAERPTAIDADPVAQKGEVVLVVDDEPTVLKQVTLLLTKLGYQTIVAVDGVAGRALLTSAARIDLLLTDVIMKNDIDGVELAREARLCRPGLKVLYMSGYTRNALIRDGIIGPTVHLITKPFRRSELALKVREVLDAG